MIDLRLDKDEIKVIVALLEQTNTRQLGSLDIEGLLRYLNNRITLTEYED